MTSEMIFTRKKISSDYQGAIYELGLKACNQSLIGFSGNQDGESHLVGLLRCEKGAVLFKSPSSVLHAPLAQSPSPSTTLV